MRVTKWEYMTDEAHGHYPNLSGFNAEYLNGYGHDGWELVSHHAHFEPDGTFARHYYTFKRQKELEDGIQNGDISQ